jgi:hypothetical protein
MGWIPLPVYQNICGLGRENCGRLALDSSFLYPTHRHIEKVAHRSPT